MKSSYSFYDKSRTDQQAVEELCSDLPPDAFEDDVMDDFGDDLTAEELCEAASVAEQTEQTFGVSKDRQTENNTKDQLAQQSNKGFDEDYFGDFDQDLVLVENETLLVQNDFTSHFPFSSKGDETKVKELATESTAVLFSADSHSTNHFASTCTNIGFNNGDRSNSAFTNSANGFGVERKSSDQINLLQEKLQKREQKTELGKREGGIDLGCVMLDKDGLNTTILNSEFKSKDVKEAIEVLPGDLADVKDKDTAIALSLAFDGAVQSLRCLDVLVLYSDEVCEVLLKSVRMHSNEEEKVQEAGTVQNDASLSSELSQGETSDLLSLLFQLVVPQPNEPSVVSLVSLGVIRSLAENCPQEHLTW
ncbi:hypothetical protein QZH41_011766 [Actinostola sp. cb2023]|nr:hypothetical protein QZH41_011766 [Actinostola sp. cb2023]